MEVYLKTIKDASSLVVDRVRKDGLSLMTHLQVLTCDKSQDPITRGLAQIWDRLFKSFVTSSPASQTALWGLRIFLGARGLRAVIGLLYVLLKLIRRRTTMVVSLGTGNPRSVSRKDAWRVTLPARDASLTALKLVDLTCYSLELVGLGGLCSGLVSSIVDPGQASVLQWFVASSARSLIRLRILRMAFEYPFELFVILPLVYAWFRFRTISSLSKAKVTVTQTVNNYYGGSKEKKVTNLDLAVVASLAMDATGLPWFAQHFLTFRRVVTEHGLRFGVTAYLRYFRAWSRSESWWVLFSRALFLSLTYPLALAATLISGVRRPVLSPDLSIAQQNQAEESAPVDRLRGARQHLSVAEQPARPGLGFEPPKFRPSNGLVTVYSFPHDVPLEVFGRGDAMLIGGDALPEIGVVRDPKLLVRIPGKPVVNNTFALGLLDRMEYTGLRERIHRLTKVPPNPYRNAVEIQKFVTAHLDWDPHILTRASNMTEAEFILDALDLVLDVSRAEKVRIPDITAESPMEFFLNAETRKHHPGWTTRAYGGQTKGDAWAYSLPRAVELWRRLRAGDASALRQHVWLFLGVVKKQATRKPDEELRDRGAVIPEQEVQLCWRNATRPLQVHTESKARSWMPKFELFHGQLRKHWLKFSQLKDVVFSNEDMTDHGASIEQKVADLLVAWVERHTLDDNGGDLGPVYRLLWREMIQATVGLPDPEGGVHLFRTSRGMKDGVDGTSWWGGLAKIVGELHKVFHYWTHDQRLRETFQSPFAVVSSLTNDCHGDNALAAYPKSLHYFSGAVPETARLLKAIGQTIKSEESLLSERLEDAYLMSWRMSNIGSLASPKIVGWKDSDALLKGFFFPERLLDYDQLAPTTRVYLGEILVALYILGYWNLETRRWLECAWRILWIDQEEPSLVVLTHIKDFVHKTGLEDMGALEPVSSESPFPYPPERVADLWLGPGGFRYVDAYAREGPAPARAAAFTKGLDTLAESDLVPVVPDYTDRFVVAASGDLVAVLAFYRDYATFMVRHWRTWLYHPFLEEAFKALLRRIGWSRAGAAFGGAEFALKSWFIIKTSPSALFAIVAHCLALPSLLLHVRSDVLPIRVSLAIHVALNYVATLVGWGARRLQEAKP